MEEPALVVQIEIPAEVRVDEYHEDGEEGVVGLEGRSRDEVGDDDLSDRVEGTDSIEFLSAPRKSLYDLTVVHSEMLDRAMNLFQQRDLDEDGLLTPSQLAEVFEELELADNEMFKDVLVEMQEGSVKAGIVDLNEFLTILRMIIASSDPEDDETRFRNAFRMFDKDGNGVLDVAELTHVLNMLGRNHYTDEEITRVFNRMDMDGSGTVDYEEFVHFLSTQKD